ncbi:MAG: ATP-dependent DNA helicase [Candidatus Thermoplasmatota archaeon]|nr:ATP-dependent DNA helicase [Candidatus Thermoplasmatota archaeon]
MHFPYSYRKHQKDMVQAIERTLQGGHIVLQSGTGSGKTVCALYPALKLAVSEGKKVLYLVRTNSQQRQVIVEMRRIGGVFGMGFQGRHSTCLAVRSNPRLREGSPEELMRYCSHKKTMTVRGERGGCKHYSNLLNADLKGIEDWAKREIPTMEQFFGKCTGLGICPYETSKLLIPSAHLVTCPYVYFFDYGIRSAFLEWMGVDTRDLVLIVDEAHNLPEYARDMRSARLTLHSLRLAMREAEKFGDVKVLGTRTVKGFCDVLYDTILHLVADYVEEDDGMLPPNQLEEDLMHKLTLTSIQLEALFHNLMSYGEVIRRKREEDGKLPRSFIFSLGAFLSFWTSMDASSYVKLANAGDSIGIEGYCLDPSHIGEMVAECQASVHMSGTLEPLVQYKETLGLPESTTLATFPSPFPSENRRVLYVEDVTTRYEELRSSEELIPRLKSHILNLVQSIPRNIVVFFPSHDRLEEFLDIGEAISRPLFVERRDSTHDELMETVDGFKTGSGVLFAVMGGRISEGLDFPDKELEMAVLVGIPYPKPTAKQRSLLRYFDIKFDKGWDYAMKAPATRRILQCIGRLIRKESDIGVAVILDKRAKSFQRKIENLDRTDDPVEETKRFFAERELLRDGAGHHEMLVGLH